MKKLLIGIAGFALFATACSEPVDVTDTQIVKAAGQPNILLVLVDDMGFSDIGAYGSEAQTPNLDRLADQGMRFNQFRNTSKCFPTRAALMTGQYAQRVGMSTSNLYFRNYATLGDVLRSAGYKTLMVGKHHALDNPYDMGFDHYWGMRDGAANHFNPGYQRAGEAYPAQKRQNARVFCFDAKCVQPFTPDKKSYFSTDTFTDWAIELLSRHEAEDNDQPFFLYLAYTAPHDPIQAWPEDIDKYEGKYDVGYEAIAKARYARQLELGIIRADTHPRSQPMHRPWDELSAEEKADQARVMAVYSAMIDNLDQNIGRVLKHLEETGELDNTLVMFLSDNGASAENFETGEGKIGAIDRWTSIGGDWANVSNVPFKAYKNSSFEGGINTPFIVSWPGVVPAGSAVNETSAHLVDIMATFVDITGATYPEASRGEAVGDMDGISLLPAFRNGTIERNKPVFFEWRNGKAVIDGNWKLVLQTLGSSDEKGGLWAFTSQEWELYDLSKDRTEINNLAANNPEKLAELKEKYEAWWTAVEPGIPARAQDQAQQVGSPLNIASFDLELIYNNDFSGDDKIDFETSLAADGKRTRLPDPQAEWVAEGWGDADVCGGKLWVAPAAFSACGEIAADPGHEPSHMVVWNKTRFPADLMFEFTVNHHGSDDGLTLVFFAAEGLGDEGIFDLTLPPRNGIYKKYNRGQLANYTVSYWSRNKAKGAIRKGERYSNRVRKNPGANMLATNASRTDKCNDCDFKLRILNVAGNITAEINGTVVNHVTDATPYGGGYIGLRSMEGVNMVSYDDFKVWSVK